MIESFTLLLCALYICAILEKFCSDPIVIDGEKVCEDYSFRIELDNYIMFLRNNDYVEGEDF